MAPVIPTKSRTTPIAKPGTAMHVLFQKLDEAIDDMEQGRVQTLDDAWKEIDAL